MSFSGAHYRQNGLNLQHYDLIIDVKPQIKAQSWKLQILSQYYMCCNYRVRTVGDKTVCKMILANLELIFSQHCHLAALQDRRLIQFKVILLVQIVSQT